MSLDVRFWKSATTQLHHLPLQLTTALPSEHLWRQFPFGRSSQQISDLLSRSLLLLVFQLSLQAVPNSIPEVCFGLKISQLPEKFSGHFRQLKFFDKASSRALSH